LRIVISVCSEQWIKRGVVILSLFFLSYRICEIWIHKHFQTSRGFIFKTPQIVISLSINWDTWSVTHKYISNPMMNSFPKRRKRERETECVCACVRVCVRVCVCVCVRRVRVCVSYDNVDFV
jgi:hypothetical protein